MMASAPPVPPAAASSSSDSLRRRDWLVIAACVGGGAALATLFFFPRYWLWCFAGAPLGDIISIQPEFNRAFFALQQLHDPWQRIDNLTHRVIEWRLLFPLLGHYLGFADGLYLALPHVGCLGALFIAASWTWRTTRQLPVTVSTTLLVATAAWYFVSTGWLAYFDSWLVAGLLLASLCRSRWVLLVVAALTPWVDERFILALPICMAVRALLSPEVVACGAWWRDARWLVFGTAPYVVIRVLAELTHTRATAEAYWDGRMLFTAPPGPTLLGWWHGLRLGWVPVFSLLGFGVRRGQWIALGAFAGGLLVNLAVADDLSRSASVVVPALVAGIAISVRDASTTRSQRLWLALAVANLLLPAAHIIATPRSPIERYHRVPILYWYAEQDHAANPPDFASPAAYTSRGIEALQTGELAIARGQFELALRYDPEFPRARAHRGIVLYLMGQKTSGLAELDHALAAAPELFDVQLQRATFRQESGDLAGALADVREALRVMPANWPKRRDAELFEQQLAGRAARAR